jgi:hypothetical protein
MSEGCHKCVLSISLAEDALSAGSSGCCRRATRDLDAKALADDSSGGTTGKPGILHRQTVSKLHLQKPSYFLDLTVDFHVAQTSK